MEQSSDSQWETTSVQNLVRHRPSGTCFARFKVGGRVVRQSLETTVFSVAKQRLPDKMRQFQGRHESSKCACQCQDDRGRLSLAFSSHDVEIAGQILCLTALPGSLGLI